MKKVTKAVIPAAGLGTRVLPATKAMPKGMLPIVDKPAIQYLVEEAVRSGITDILIILSRSQSIIEDHFDRSPELEAKLAAPGKEKMLEECLGISNLANIMFVRQHQTLGLGHAVSMAKAFTGDDPFVVIYGDDVIWGEDPVCAQLIRAYEEFGRPVAGVSAVPWADVSRYCSLKTTPLHDNYFFVDDMIEKPKKGQEFSNYSILGRVLLTGIVLAAAVVAMTVFFKVKTISVEGAKQYGSEELIAGMDVQKGDNLYLWNKNRVLSDLMHSFPYLESAQLRRKLPDGLVLTVTECTAAAAVRNEDNTFTYISAGGKVLENNAADGGLPIVLGVTLNAQMGDFLDTGTDAHVDAMLNVLENMDAAGLLEKMSFLNLMCASAMTSGSTSAQAHWTI